MTLSEKIESAIDSRDDIQSAITTQGVTVDNTVPLSQYADKILEIQATGGITPGIKLWGNDFDGTKSVDGMLSTGPFNGLQFTEYGASIKGGRASADKAITITIDTLNSNHGYILLDAQYMYVNPTYTRQLMIPSSVNSFGNPSFPAIGDNTKFFINTSWIVDGSLEYTRYSADNAGDIKVSKTWLNTQIENSSAVSNAITTHNSDNTAHPDILNSVNTAVTSKENISNKVAISSTATTSQYPNAKSVWDLVQNVIATIPAGGLKVPLPCSLESTLEPLNTRSIGDYYYIQDMDITAPGRTGRAWVNYIDLGNPNSGLQYYKVFDQYQSMDGVSITQTTGGEWEVDDAWLKSKINAEISEETDPIFNNWLFSEFGLVCGNQKLVNASEGTEPTDVAIVSQIPKKGNILPLEDGVASIGISTEYAPMDHVHPINSSQNDFYEYLSGTTTLTSLLGIQFNTRINYYTVSINASLTIASVSFSSQPYVIFCRNTSGADRTITLPSNSVGTVENRSFIVPNGKYAEISIVYDSVNSIYRILTLVY